MENKRDFPDDQIHWETNYEMFIDFDESASVLVLLLKSEDFIDFKENRLKEDLMAGRVIFAVDSLLNLIISIVGLERDSWYCLNVWLQMAAFDSENKQVTKPEHNCNEYDI